MGQTLIVALEYEQVTHKHNIHTESKDGCQHGLLTMKAHHIIKQQQEIKPKPSLQAACQAHAGSKRGCQDTTARRCGATMKRSRAPQLAPSAWVYLENLVGCLGAVSASTHIHHHDTTVHNSRPENCPKPIRKTISRATYPLPTRGCTASVPGLPQSRLRVQVAGKAQEHSSSLLSLPDEQTASRPTWFKTLSRV